MKIKMKETMYNGQTNTGLYWHQHAPLPGSDKYEARLAAHANIVANAPRTGTKEYYKKAASMLKLGKGKPKTLLDLHVCHGDIVIMHGSDVQDCFVHGVTHEDRLRAAFTARFIDPASVAPEHLPPYEVHPDSIHYDGTKLALPRDHLGNPIGDIFGLYANDAQSNNEGPSS